MAKKVLGYISASYSSGAAILRSMFLLGGWSGAVFGMEKVSPMRPVAVSSVIASCVCVVLHLIIFGGGRVRFLERKKVSKSSATKGFRQDATCVCVVFLSAFHLGGRLVFRLGFSSKIKAISGI